MHVQGVYLAMWALLFPVECCWSRGWPGVPGGVLTRVSKSVALRTNTYHNRLGKEVQTVLDKRVSLCFDLAVYKRASGMAEKHVGKQCSNELVMGSLSSALESSLPIVLTKNTPTTSPSPRRKKQASKFKLHDLLRPLSPNFKSDSDDSPTSPKRWHSPHTRKKRMKVRSGNTKSADNSPVRDYVGDSSPTLPGGLETTQVDSLPGQHIQKNDSITSIGVPTILVSPDGEDDCLGFERKTSLSSHLSATSSIITSGANDCSKRSNDHIIF